MRQRQNQQLPGRNAGQQENGAERFASYTQHLAAHTRKRHWRELASLRAFLLQQGSSLGDLAIDAPSWAIITTDLIYAYLTHLQQRGIKRRALRPNSRRSGSMRVWQWKPALCIQRSTSKSTRFGLLCKENKKPKEMRFRT